MRKSTAVPIALLSAVAIAGMPVEVARAVHTRSSVVPAMIERGGFGETLENYWPLIGVVGVIFLMSYFSGGE